MVRRRQADGGGARGGCRITVTAGSTDNIKAVPRAVCAKMLAGDDTGEEKLAAEVDMYWQIVAPSWKP